MKIFPVPSTAIACGSFIASGSARSAINACSVKVGAGNKRSALLVLRKRWFPAFTTNNLLFIVSIATPEAILNNVEHEKKPALLANIYIVLSENYRGQGLFEKAIEFSLNADKIAIATKDTTQQILVLGIMGLSLTQTAEYDKAFFYYRKGLELSRIVKSSSDLQSLSFHIASSFFLKSQATKLTK